MSEAPFDTPAPVRERVNPRRPGRRQPHAALHKSPWPWNDRTGRLSKHKTVALILEVLPALWMAWGYASHQLGANPIKELIHATGLMSIRFLMLSLLVSPARAIFNWHKLMLVRRQLGIAALFYGMAHLVLYAVDEKWSATTTSSEILLRTYLTVGLVSLVGLAYLGWTSFDTTLRRMGRDWKRVHRLAYGICALALVHFFLQSKSNVDQALLMSGLFLWLMGWRAMPAGPDRAPLPILALGCGMGVLTAALEYGWFALATHIDPLRPVRAELDLGFGPHPAGQVFLVGIAMAIATGLFWANHRENLREGLPFAVTLYGGGAAIVAALSFAFSLETDWLPDDWPFWDLAALFIAAFAFAGVVRWYLPRMRLAIDVTCAVCLLAPVCVGLFV